MAIASMMMNINLYDHQIDAIGKLRTGSILCGGVGSGKSRTSIAYFFTKECGGSLKINGHGFYKKMANPKDLYIITTARKRDTGEWEKECYDFCICKDPSASISKKKLVIDSWNNIKKYVDVENAFFIFDEQRVIGYGAWTKAFLKIAKHNHWILLSATPGDTWSDYIPVFIANGFYKNKTEFERQHVIYSRFSKYPKVDRYVNCGLLIKHRKDIVVMMPFERSTISHNYDLVCQYDKELTKQVMVNRWDIFKNEPIQDAGQVCYILRQIANSDPSRLRALDKVYSGNHHKLIIFYNFNYELDLLRDWSSEKKISCAEWNGHKHEPIPKTDEWIYLVQYTAGAEGWNCIETDTIIFFSQNYSYKVMVQSAGRIDRLNTPFRDLYYYHLVSKSPIDRAIAQKLRNKQSFNEANFLVEASTQKKRSI